MGICSSSAANDVATAKLILHDGTLQQFSYPVKVSHVLQKNPACFICNSDEMDFDGALSAINEHQELQIGQIYFALPLSELKRRLRPEEMAALAVKASSALMKYGVGERCERLSRSPAPVFFSGRKERSGGGGGGGGRRKFAVELSAIPE